MQIKRKAAIAEGMARAKSLRQGNVAVAGGQRRARRTSPAIDGSVQPYQTGFARGREFQALPPGGSTWCFMAGTRD